MATAAAASAAVFLVCCVGLCEGSERAPAAWTPEDMFGQEAALRRELAALQTERSWLRAPPRREFWSPHEAMEHLAGLHQEIASLRAELAWLRREDTVRRPNGDIASVASRPPPLEDADHAPTMFITMCAGSVYFDAYCGPLLASFERAYGGAASKHRFLVFHSSVDAPLLESAAERFRPWAHFEPLPRVGLNGKEQDDYNSTTTGNSDNLICHMQGSKDMVCQVTSDGVENRGNKVNNNNFEFPFHVSKYLKKHRHENFCHAVLLDSDTLIVRPLGRFLNECESGLGRQVDWDLAFTVYDEQFSAPWAADVTEVSRTRNGLSRINAGVVLLSLHQPEVVERFLRSWAEATNWLYTGGEGGLNHSWEGADKRLWEHWREELLAEFRGPNQASLALLLSSYDVPALFELIGWGTCAACLQAVEARVDLLSGKDVLLVRMRALPARILNHPESMHQGAFPEDLLIVHLKGLWWRTLLPIGGLFFSDPHRKVIWNRDAIALHRLLYETWHAALPPEAVPRTDSRILNDGGEELTSAEAEQWVNSHGERGQEGQPVDPSAG